MRLHLLAVATIAIAGVSAKPQYGSNADQVQVRVRESIEGMDQVHKEFSNPNRNNFVAAFSRDKIVPLRTSVREKMTSSEARNIVQQRATEQPH